jgi:hypothetical protein
MARAKNLTLGAPAVSGVLINTGGQIRRMSTRETTGGAGAEFQLFDGTGTNGQLVDTIALSAGQSTRDQYRIHEYPFYNGLYLNVINGTFEGAMTVHLSDDWDTEGEPVIIIGTLDLTIGQ